MEKLGVLLLVVCTFLIVVCAYELEITEATPAFEKVAVEVTRVVTEAI